MSQIEFVLHFGEEAEKRYMIQTGERPNGRYSLELKDFTPEERARILNADRHLKADRVPQNKADWMTLIEAHLEEKRQEANQKAKKYLDMGEEELVSEALNKLSTYKPTDDPVRILDLQRADEALKSSLRQRWAKAVQQALEKKAEEERKKRAEREAREAREKAEQERKEALRQAWEKMREEWILAHGSERLVKAFKMGYECDALFEQEFAAFHFPKAECDWHDEATWRERRCPSMKALQQVEEYQKRFPDWEFQIVWLTSPPRPFEMNRQDYAGRDQLFEPREAIAIKIPGFSSYIIEKV